MIYAATSWRRFQLTAFLSAFGALAAAPAVTSGQAPATLLTTRAELTDAADQAESLAATGNVGAKMKNALLAASIRQRLRDGDFQPGDRVIITIVSDMRHTDTLVVRSGRVLELPGKISLPLSGVLRSELEARTSTEVLKYVKAAQVTVTPLTRIAVLGEVSHPGYFALASDVPLTDAIMAAGGPTVTADVERTIVRRGSQEYRSPDETRQAVSRGLTIDQFGLRAGDELVVGKKRNLLGGPLFGVVGALASLTAVFVTLSR
jgi:protein involved in polysaccharide export with SLBB domain